MCLRSNASFALVVVLGIVSAGCHRPELTTSGARVAESRKAPPPSCERVADVRGRAGGAIEGSMLGLDEKELARFALNSLRNAAAEQGADYVYRSEPTFSAPYGHVTQAEYAGYAYRCSPRR